MAYLPTVNEFANNRPTKEGASKIVKSVNRMDLTSVDKDNLLNRKAELEETKTSEKMKSSVGSSENSSSILGKLYNFVVKDYNERDLKKDNIDYEEQQYENDAQERELSLLKAIPELLNQRKEEDEDKEGIFSKLWRYFKYFSFGKMVFNNWDKISKLLGLEKLTESIRGLANEFGLTGILQNIKDVIDDIMTGFSEKVSPYLPQFMGGEPSQEEIRLSKESVNPKEVYDYLRSKGVDHEHAMGMLTNIMGESGFRPGVIGDDGTSGGLFQHHNERFAKMKSFAGPDWQKDWKKQVDFALTEKETKDYLSTSYGSGKEATVGFTKKFEKPKDADAAARERLKYTESLENRVKGESTTPNSNPTTTQEQNTSSNTPVQKPTEQSVVKPEKTSEQKPAFSVAPKKDVFETKPAIENVFETTTTAPKPKPKSVDSVETKKQPTAQRVSKKDGEPGEIGTNQKGTIQKQEQQIPDGIADEADLKGLSFADHTSKGNPLTLEKQITKYQAQKLHDLMGVIGVSSLNINSGRRSKEYNSTLEGAADKSEHLNGRATDISTRGMSDAQRVAFVKAASQVGFGGIGVYDTFIHLDTGKIRTWPGKGVKLSSEMNGALFAHESGRRGQQTDTTTVPSYDEPGELSSDQKSGIAKESQKPKSFLETAIDAYKGQTEILSNIFSPDMFKQFEESIINVVNEIPKKERLMPDISGLTQQNNYIVNMAQEQRSIMQNTTSNQGDLPPIFQQFLERHTNG